MIKATKAGLSKMPQATFMLWFPIKSQAKIESFYNDLRKLGVHDTIKSELYFYSDIQQERLNGSGMVIFKPPWGCPPTLRRSTLRTLKDFSL